MSARLCSGTSLIDAPLCSPSPLQGKAAFLCGTPASNADIVRCVGRQRVHRCANQRPTVALPVVRGEGRCFPARATGDHRFGLIRHQ